MITNLFNREEFTLKTIPLRNDNARQNCLKLLTLNKHLELPYYINVVIENSSHFLFYHTSDTMIVAIAFVQIKFNVLDIFLLCAIPCDKRYGSMMVYALHNFAIRKKCTKVYTSSRTATLRHTFMKYGFEHLRGIADIDEVLVKYIRTDKTLKLKKYRL